MHKDCVIHDVEQGSDEWHQVRCGLITASEVRLLMTPTLKVANNDKSRSHIYELSAQRLSGYVEPTYISDEMLAGHTNEVIARDLYSDAYEPIEEVGFITRDFGGVTIGYSPDGVAVMSNKGIEIKSRRQKYHVRAVIDDEVPPEHILQVQTGLLVTGWDSIDFITYSAGLPMWVTECKPIAEYQDAILSAAVDAESKINEMIEKYQERIASAPVLIQTEREDDAQEVYFDE